MTPPADDQTPRRLATWANRAPIGARWLALLLLVLLGSPLAVAWFTSGFLMLVHCVFSEVAAEEADRG